MKVNSLKKLDRNDYERIVIRRGKYNEVIVDIKNNNKYSTIKTDYPGTFSNDIKNLNVTNKVREIIKYFIRNTNISFIKENQKLDNFQGLFLVIGNDDRKLLFKNLNGIIDDSLKKDIISKYLSDRNLFLSNNSDIKNISFNIGDNAEYYIEDAEQNYDKSLHFNLIEKGENLIHFDKVFFLNFMSNLIDNSNNIINTEYVMSENGKKSCRLFGWPNALSFQSFIEAMESKSYFNEHNGFYLYIDSYTIRLPEDYYNKLLEEKVLEHNRAIDESKKLQLSFFDKGTN